MPAPEGWRTPARTPILALILVLITGCSQSTGPSPTDTDTLTFQAFGTLVDVTLHPAGAHELPRIERELRFLLDSLHQSWHAWEPGLLTETNERLRSGESFPPDPMVAPLIDAGIHYWRLSDGLFDPALGRLSAAWGFHGSEPDGPPPDPETLAALLAEAPSMRDLFRREDGRIRSRNPAVQLDFGGLAKGLAVALALEKLQELGVRNAIFNAGGDLMTMGTPTGRDWRIGIKDPHGAGVLGGIELGPGEALFSSGTYERGYQWEGERVHHLLDPRTGHPSRGVLGVTVLDEDPVRADAVATALVLAGPQDWPRYAARMNAHRVLVVLDSGAIEVTPQLFERLELQVDRPVRQRSVEPADG